MLTLPLRLLAVLCATSLAAPVDQQQLALIDTDSMAAPTVYGHNNATYGPIPKADQIFEIQALEIAPSPIIAYDEPPVERYERWKADHLRRDRIIFIWLRGEIAESKKKSIDNAALANATLAISLSADYPDGTHDDRKTYTIPLRTQAYKEDQHIAFRDAAGIHVEHLTIDGPNDILADTMIPAMFLRTGEWTFEIVAKLADGTCLFALSLTQFLKGRINH